jgi:hypothetical protein
LRNNRPGERAVPGEYSLEDDGINPEIRRGSNRLTGCSAEKSPTKKI